MSESGKLKIGAWTASPALNLLEYGTRSVRLEPRAMDVLMALAGRAGAVVSVDELLASVWKGVIVGEGSVYLAIRQLRQALDDSPAGAHYIETIPKRGYRLTAHVEQFAHSEPVAVEPAPGLQAPSLAHPVPPPASGRRIVSPLRLGLAILVAAVLIGSVALIVRRGALAGPVHTVAVLPFDNLSSDPEQQYFADGITAELLNTLAQVRDLRVTGRISSFHFKDRNADLREIGAALGVEHVVEGSVRKSGQQVRITAQLSDVRTGQQLWSETYERRLDDIFVIQDEIARAVTNALQIRLGVGDLGRMPGMTHNVSAYDEYLRGMTLNLDSQAESFVLAIAHLQRAVALDPSSSVLWIGLHTVCANGALISPEHADEWRQQATAALGHARALTPDAPYVLLWIGIGESRRGRFREAAAVFEQLQAAYTRYGVANQAWGPRGALLLGVGRLRAAIPALERARMEDPLAPAYAQFLGLAKSGVGDVTGALAEVDRGLALEGLDTYLQGMALVIAMSRDDRVGIDQRLRAMPESDPALRINRNLARFMDGPAGAVAEIRRLAAAAGPAEKAVLAHWAAYYHAPELSLELLAEIAPNMGHLGALWQPLLRDVRKLPAFKDLVRKLGLVEYWRTYGWSDFCQPLNREEFTCE